MSRFKYKPEPAPRLVPYKVYIKRLIEELEELRLLEPRFRSGELLIDEEGAVISSSSLPVDRAPAKK